MACSLVEPSGQVQCGVGQVERDLTMNPHESVEGTNFGQTRFGHPDLTNFGQSNFGQSNFGQSIFDHRGLGPANGQNQFCKSNFGQSNSGFGVCHGPKWWGPNPEKSSPEGWGLEGWVRKGGAQGGFDP